MPKLMNAARILIKNLNEFGKRTRFQIQKNAEWQPMLWPEYVSRIAHITLWLKEMGLQPGEKSAVLCSTRVEWALTGLAIQSARGVLVPIYHSNTPDQIHYVIQHSDARFLFVEKSFLTHSRQILRAGTNLDQVVVIDAIDQDDVRKFLPDEAEWERLHRHLIPLDAVYGQNPDFSGTNLSAWEKLVDQIEDHDLCSILYTSGTTGMPKGVLLTHNNVVTNAEDWIATLGSLIPKERVDLLWLPLSHIFGWGEIGLGNTLGFETWLSNPKEVLGLMPLVRPTVFMSVPAYWEKLYVTARSASEDKDLQMQKLKELTGGRLGFCLSGGAGLKREVKDFYYRANILIIEGYGLTESSPTLTMNRPDDFDFDTVGKPFPRVQVRLGSDGEILAKGANVFQGYYKNEEATKEAFDEDGWLKTGDLGQFTESGFLKIIGRKKDIIVNSGGKNISPQLIEAHFIDFPYIEHVVLYGNEKKYLTALITMNRKALFEWVEQEGLTFQNYQDLIRRPQIKRLIQDAIDKVNSRVAHHETLKKFFVLPQSLSIEEGHLTPSLKIKRSAIHKAFQNLFEALYE